jgi:hypothetical protein
MIRKKTEEETNIPYQSLINLYVRVCSASKRKLDMKWVPSKIAANRVEQPTFFCPRTTLSKLKCAR